MRYEHIADIYSANEKFHEQLATTLKSISADEATALPEGEKWSINQIAEHISIVDFGITRICSKLLEAAKADGIQADGSFSLSANFGEQAAIIAGIKVDAPERVHPTGDVTIDQALERIQACSEVFDSLKADLESFDLSGHKFPHPFIGDMDAGEWLVMAGLHKQRHLKQIEGLLAIIRQ